MKRIFLVGMVLAFGLVFVGCGNAGNDRSILGTWHGHQLGDIPISFTFHSDGSFEWNQDTFSWERPDEGTFTARDGQITLRTGRHRYAGTYTISGNTVRLNLEGEGSMTLRR